MLKRLEQEIEQVRMKMEQSATEKGITHPEVYKLSKELDRLHNLWNHMLKDDHELYFRRSGHSFIREALIVHR